MYIERSETHWRTVPFFKEPGLSQRLPKDSAHAYEVHRAWPCTMLHGLAGLTGHFLLRLFPGRGQPMKYHHLYRVMEKPKVS